MPEKNESHLMLPQQSLPEVPMLSQEIKPVKTRGRMSFLWAPEGMRLSWEQGLVSWMLLIATKEARKRNETPGIAGCLPSGTVSDSWLGRSRLSHFIRCINLWSLQTSSPFGVSWNGNELLSSVFIERSVANTWEQAQTACNLTYCHNMNSGQWS